MKIQAAVRELPSWASASVRVEYSPDLVPDPRTVKQLAGALVRAVLLTRDFGTAALEMALRNSSDSRK